MPGTTNQLVVRGEARQMFFEQLDAPGTTSPPQRFIGDVTVQVAGTANSITAIVERSSQDPGSGQEDWAPAESENISGDLSAGIAPRPYIEPGVGWWRVRVTELAGGYARISMAGGKG